MVFETIQDELTYRRAQLVLTYVEVNDGHISLDEGLKRDIALTAEIERLETISHSLA